MKFLLRNWYCMQKLPIISHAVCFRFIIHSDVANPTLSALEDFGQAMKKFDPDLLVVSGLQMMDNFPFRKSELTPIGCNH